MSADQTARSCRSAAWSRGSKGNAYRRGGSSPTWPSARTGLRRTRTRRDLPRGQRRWPLRTLLFVLISAHGVIHFLGFAKGAGLAELPQLTLPISRAWSLVWLAAGVLTLTAAVLFLTASRYFWVIGFAAVVLSQAAILASWSDARAGTLPNLVLLAMAVWGYAAWGPGGLHAEYERAVRTHSPAIEQPRVTEPDLLDLPSPLQAYLRAVGVVGQPRMNHVRATWRGRIRATAADPWMHFTAEQHNFFGDAPARFFFMRARRGGLPVDVYHAFEQGEASMRVRLLSLFPMASMAGPDLTRAETVTLFNDLCILAPGALLDAPARWEPIDAATVRAHYTVGSNTIRADLIFNAAGELVDFVSDDRLAASPDGKRFTQRRWSTPVRAYRQYGPWRLMSHGEGWWHAPGEPFVYIELELVDVRGSRTR